MTHHPLSEHALGVLRRLLRGPIEAYLINPGVRGRLWREGLAEDRWDSDGKHRYYITEVGKTRVPS